MNSFNFNLPSFWQGYASSFDFTGRAFKFPDFSGGFERDRQSLAGDWQRVGNDMRKAMDIVAHAQ